MGADDPDAMWRPGFTGAIVYPQRAPVPDVARPRRAPWRLVVVVGAAAALAAGAVVAVAHPRPGDPAESSDARPRVPAALHERWSAALGPVDVVAAVRSDDAIVVWTSDGLSGLDVDTGTSRWVAAVPAAVTAQLGVVGDVVVAVADGTIAAVDASDGRVLWRRPSQPGNAVILDGGRVLVATPSALELLDPHSGRAAAAVLGDRITWSSAAARRYQDRRIDLFDHASLRPLGSVDLTSIGLADAASVDAAPTDEGILVASATAAVLVDGSGTVRATLPLGAPASAATIAEVQPLDADGRHVAIQRGVRLTVVATIGGQLTELWSDDAWVLDAVVAGGHGLVATASITFSQVATPQVVDADTGRPAWDGPAVVQSAPLQVFAGDGFIAVDRRVDPADVVGYDLDRAERWRHPIAAGAHVVLVDDGLLEIADHLTTSTTVTFLAGDPGG